MSTRRIVRYGLICWFAAILSACSTNTASAPTSQPTQVASLLSALPARPTLAPASQATPPLVEVPTAQPPTQPATTPVPAPPTVAGETVLTLGRGDAADQIGANATFRIGADGSIRILDSEHKRLLFYNVAGEFQSVRPLPEANNPQDFIVANSGELFVLDYAGDTPDRSGPVLHYNADGSLKQRIAVATDISPNAIMLNANNDLLLVGFGHYWLAMHNNLPLAPELQAFTMHNGVVTPRSPLVFVNEFDGTSSTIMQVQSPTDLNLTNVVLNVPSEQTFFNVDRAMNLYTTSFLSNASIDGINIARYTPNGVMLGGAHIDANGCSFTGQVERQFYIDQAGAAWTLCITPQQTTINRYTLVDGSGQPLPIAANEPADVQWKPGASFSPG